MTKRRNKKVPTEATERDRDAEAEAAWSRDPRQAPFGILSGDSFVLSSLRVFLWFESVEQLIDHLLDVEPRQYKVTPSNGLGEYQARVRPILARASEEGLTEHLRREFNPAEDGGFVVDWWGRYEDLRDGRDDFGCEVRDAFARRWGGDERAPLDREDEFVEYLWNYGV
jgi:hypothetical protein